jgi:hypothetical protein
VAFSYDITTSRGRVRFNLADTTSTAYVFEDAEIDELISSEGSVGDATAAALRTLLADRARRSKRFSMQGLSLDDTAQLAEIRYLITLWGGDLPTVASVMPALLPMDTGFTEPTVS